MDPEAFPKLVGPHQLPPIGDSEELVPAEPGLERSREHFPAKKHPRSELPKTGVISGLQEVMDAVLLEAVVEGHRTAVYSQKRQTQPSARCGPSGHIRVEPARARMGVLRRPFQPEASTRKPSSRYSRSLSRPSTTSSDSLPRS